MNLPPRDLNSGPYLPHPTSTYICGVIIISRMYGGMVLTYWELSISSVFFPYILLQANDFKRSIKWKFTYQL